MIATRWKKCDTAVERRARIDGSVTYHKELEDPKS